jgi:hypothetical protein
MRKFGRRPTGFVTTIGIRKRSASTPSSELTVEVPGGSALPAPFGDRGLQPVQGSIQGAAVGCPSPAPALVEPLDRRPVATLPIATPACGYLVFDPGRTALDPGDQVVGGGNDQAGEPSFAPETAVTVPLQDHSQPLCSVELRPEQVITHPTMVPDPVITTRGSPIFCAA